MPSRSTQEVVEISGSNPSHVRSTQEVILISVVEPPVGINYPLTPPAISGIGPQDFTMIEMNVVGETESPFTLSQQEQQWAGQQFQLELNLPPLLQSEAEQWIAFLGSLFGKYGTFLMGDYNRPTPVGPMSGSPVVSGTNLNGSNSLNLRGATASVANWAVAGDYIQVTSTIAGAVQRIYKVLQNASTDGSGNVQLEIFPCIRETLLDGDVIVIENCAGTFRLMDNQPKWKIDRNKMYAISFKAKEAI